MIDRVPGATAVVVIGRGKCRLRQGHPGEFISATGSASRIRLRLRAFAFYSILSAQSQIPPGSHAPKTPPMCWRRVRFSLTLHVQINKLAYNIASLWRRPHGPRFRGYELPVYAWRIGAAGA